MVGASDFRVPAKKMVALGVRRVAIADPDLDGIVSPAEALDVIPLLPRIYDEPFADSSQIPTWLISQLAREHVIVCLSGDGGDELFGGYHRYQHINRIRNKLAWCPRTIRKPLALLYDLVRNRWLRGRTEPGLAARIAAAGSDRELYSLLNRHWSEGSAVVLEGDARREVAVEHQDVAA
jgi:asparagine synthase (glutamine-hydrolysing)